MSLPAFPFLLPAAARRITGGAMAMGVAVGMWGCASFSAPAAAEMSWQMPADWSQSTVAASTALMPLDLAAWWAAFDDPLLTQWITRALEANTSVRSAQAALQQARALRDVAQAQSGPSVVGSQSVQRSRVGQGVATSSWRAGLDATWELDVWGRQANALAATQADLQSSEANLAALRVSLAAEVATAYLEWRSLQTRLRIARSHLATQEETAQITAWRVSAGLASALDAEQAQTAVAQTRAQIPVLQNSSIQLRHAVAVLMAQPPSATDEVPEAEVPQPHRRLSLAFPADTLLQRPDVRAAGYRVTAAWARLHQTDAARLPNFSLGGSLGLAAPRWSDLWSVPALTRTWVVGLSATLWDGGAVQAQVRAQQAVLEQARIAHEAVLLDALKEVEDALSALRHDHERLTHLQAAAQSAAQAELLARQRYAAGLIDFRTVLDTQRTLLTTQSDAATARASWSTNHVRLYKALGGGWTPTPEDSK